MFIKELIIYSPKEQIRDIVFKSGLNLIIDNTPTEDVRSTGNDVGKTTVLKLVDFCLGASSNIIYTDMENKKEVYDVVKNFLIENEIQIKLILTEDLNDSTARQVEIIRNFLPRKKGVRKINGRNILEQDFELELSRCIFPDKTVEKPTFRQIISHNIRYRDEHLNSTLKTLDKYTSDVEYETLYLYLLGCTYEAGADKQMLITKINQEYAFRSRLEEKQSKAKYEIAVDFLNDEIEQLNKKKASFNLNENAEEDLEQLNKVKYEINKKSARLSRLQIRKSLIEESQKELESTITQIDLKQLKQLYEEANKNISGLQKTFEDLVAYHNNMVVEKMKYIVQDLPTVNEEIQLLKKQLAILFDKEKVLTGKVSKSDSFGELEKVIFELNEKYRLKGEYESIIAQISDVEDNIKLLNDQITAIDKFLFSQDFESVLKEQIKKFNKLFAYISQELYNERYAISSERTINKKGQQYYKFNAFNTNLSTGKKQGEILCFDLAYLLFADEEQMSCLHFLLNDKKELMHDNQLIKIAEFIRDKNVQVVISILKDKLPSAILDKAHIAVELSQKDKLFRIE